VLTLAGHDDAIMALGFDQRGYLLTGGLDQAVRIWKITSPEGK
jgi:WD domain, G-beta repeat